MSINYVISGGLLDVIKGDASLFTRGDAIELSWRLIDPILEGWRSDAAPPMTFYESRSWGPIESDRMIGQSGNSWLVDCGEHD